MQNSNKTKRVTMGTSSSALVAMMEESEMKLLDFGIRWHASLELKLGSTPAPVTYKTMNIKIGGSKNEHHIHTIKYISSEEKEKGTPILFIHGYGSGAGIWHLTLPIFATFWNGPVYAIDSFGCGLSSRPAWNGPMGSELDVDECEDLFSAVKRLKVGERL